MTARRSSSQPRHRVGRFTKKDARCIANRATKFLVEGSSGKIALIRAIAVCKPKFTKKARAKLLHAYEHALEAVSRRRARR